jgi:hypothetical protein
MDRGSNYFLLNSDESLEMSNLSQSRSSGGLRIEQPSQSSYPRLSATNANLNLIRSQGNQPSSLSSYVPPNAPTVQTEPLKKIKCANCPTELSYPEEAYCVCCFNCKTMTAVKALSSHLCLICLTTIYYLAGQKIVKCRCGKVYDMSKTRS